MSENLLVYVLDEDHDLAASLCCSLCRAGHVARVFCKPAALVAAHGEKAAHCVITEVLMSETHGFDFADQVRAIDPTVGIIFMTAQPSTSLAVDAVRHHGGIDYLEKPINEARLQASVREAFNWSMARRRVLNRLAALSRRERDVFNLLVRGMSNKSIASHLQISTRTVEDHRAKIAAKTGAHNLEQMIALTITDQMISLVSGQNSVSGIPTDRLGQCMS